MGGVPQASVSDLPAAGIALIDVREHDEWAAGHAPGAVHIPMGELPARVDELKQLPDDKPLYIVCRSGGRSARVTMWLNANGLDAVNVDGGMQSWQIQGRPLVSDEPGAEPEIL